MRKRRGSGLLGEEEQLNSEELRIGENRRKEELVRKIESK